VYDCTRKVTHMHTAPHDLGAQAQPHRTVLNRSLLAMRPAIVLCDSLVIGGAKSPLTCLASRNPAEAVLAGWAALAGRSGSWTS